MRENCLVLIFFLLATFLNANPEANNSTSFSADSTLRISKGIQIAGDSLTPPAVSTRINSSAYLNGILIYSGSYTGPEGHPTYSFIFTKGTYESEGLIHSNIYVLNVVQSAAGANEGHFNPSLRYEINKVATFSTNPSSIISFYQNGEVETDDAWIEPWSFSFAETPPSPPGIAIPTGSINISKSTASNKDFVVTFSLD